VPATRSDTGVEPAAAEALSALRRQLEQLAVLRQSGVLADAAYDEARQVLERRIVDAIGWRARRPSTTAITIWR